MRELLRRDNIDSYGTAQQQPSVGGKLDGMPSALSPDKIAPQSKMVFS